MLDEKMILDVKDLAIKFHNSFYCHSIDANEQPIYIACMLLALEDEKFKNSYQSIENVDKLIFSAEIAIKKVLLGAKVSNSKIDEIVKKFVKIKNTSILDISLDNNGSLLWYFKELEQKIIPIMKSKGETIDVLGLFYHQFQKYAGKGRTKGLGIVLTPQHIADFMAEAIHINKNSKVVDLTCGSGTLLTAAINKMFEDSLNDEEIDYIKKNSVYGIELDSIMNILALTNMILRCDGTANIYEGDCFDDKVWKNILYYNKKEKLDSEGRQVLVDRCILNPPYGLKNKCELEFVEHALDNILCEEGELAVICPVSCALGYKYKDVRKRLMQKHTLKAVFSMPDKLFVDNNASVITCIMIWQAKVPHNTKKETYFGYYKDDGFVKTRKGRIDKNLKWNEIKKKWLRNYDAGIEEAGLSAKACVTDEDEWLCEAYMETDYSKLTEDDFKKTVNDYLAYLVKEGKVYG